MIRAFLEKTGVLVGLAMIAIPLMIWARYEYINYEASKANKERQIGVYTIDLSRTDFGNNDSLGSSCRSLTLEFKSDMTFVFNKSVPFIYDSAGTWTASGADIEEWNEMHYNSNPGFSTQFSHCCDSLNGFYMNSVTPENGIEPILAVYFKRGN